MSQNTSPNSTVKVYRRDWRGQLLSDGVAHKGQAPVAIWMEVFNTKREVLWTCDLEHALADAVLVLGKEPLLSCRLVGLSVDVVGPELLLVLAQVFEREIRYRNHRMQVLAGDFCDPHQGDMGQGGGSCPDGRKCLSVYPEAADESFIRKEIALGFVAGDQIVKGHASSLGGEA